MPRRNAADVDRSSTSQSRLPPGVCSTSAPCQQTAADYPFPKYVGAAAVLRPRGSAAPARTRPPCRMPFGLALGAERERGSGIAATRYPMKRIAVCCLQVIELSRSCGSCSENISTRLLYQYLNNYLYSKRPSYTFGGACNFKLRKKVRTRIRNFCIET